MINLWSHNMSSKKSHSKSSSSSSSIWEREDSKKVSPQASEHSSRDDNPDESFASLLDEYPFEADQKYQGAGETAPDSVGSAVSHSVKRSPRNLPRSTSPPQRGSSQHHPLDVDLHGKTLRGSQEFIESEIFKLCTSYAPNSGAEIHLKIITGRGRHSSVTRGGILSHHIHCWMQGRYRRAITRIEACPSSSKIGGLTVRGHFHVSLRVRDIPLASS